MMRTALLIAGICLLTACKKENTEEPEAPVEVKRTVEYFVTDADGPHLLQYTVVGGSINREVFEGDVHITQFFSPGDTVIMFSSAPTGRIRIKVEGLDDVVDTVPPLMLGQVVR